jgi:hypothetical protein
MEAASMIQFPHPHGKTMFLVLAGALLAAPGYSQSIPGKTEVNTSQPKQQPGEKSQPPAKGIRETYPLPFADIKATLAELSKSPAIPDPVAKERESALQKLKAYRFLCELPYKDLKLDATMNEHAEAAAKVCEKLGRLDHNPPNPGLPEAEYQKGLLGAKSSNLAAGFPKVSLLLAVDMFMNDSDAGNIVMLGHRRWCLNPFMGKTGLGKAGAFAAMWSIDFSNQGAKFDRICYPARGFMPMEFFNPNYAWSVILDPKKYVIPNDAAVDVKIFPVDLAGKKTGAALALNHKSVSRHGVGGVPLCLIFRPDKSAVAAGQRYLVEMDGVNSKDGKAASLQYPVEFVSLAAGPGN